MASKQDNKDMNTITNKFIDMFLRINPQNTLPSWFKKKTTHQTLDKGGTWRLSIVASKKNINGDNPNIIIDEDSNEKKYIIANSYEEIVLFSMDFDKSDLSGVVVINKDLSLVNGEDLVDLG